MDFGWPAPPPAAGGACSDLNLLQEGLLIDLDDKTLQCLMGGPTAGFAACISGGCSAGGAPLPGEAASGSGGKREREEEIAAADEDDDSEEGGAGGGGGGRGRSRGGKKGKAADAASIKATREKARRERLNECFEELARLCDPSGKIVRTDRISIVQDAIRAMGALRVENNQLRQLNKFLEERVRHLETARAQGMYQQHMMQQMAVQQMQQQQQQQQMQPQPMAAPPPHAPMAPQQVAQPAAGDAQQQAAPLRQAPSGGLATGGPMAGPGPEGQPDGSGGLAGQQLAPLPPDAAQQAPQQQQQAQQQQAQQAQQAAPVVPPGMMLVPVSVGGAPPMAAQPYGQGGHPLYSMKSEGMDPCLAASTSGGAGMGLAPSGSYVMAPAGGVAPGMGGGGMQAAGAALGGLPQVMPANAPPVSWLPAPDISQDGKLRPPAA